MSKLLLIYHGDCPDGFTASWLMNSAMPGLVEHYAAKHGDQPPDVTGRDVVMVDFSYPGDHMARMIEQSKSFVFIDHHVTGLERLRQAQRDGHEPNEVLFDLERSGAMLMWDWLSKRFKAYNPEAVPWLVSYVQDRDLWRNKLPRSREVSAWILCQDMTFENWTRLRADGFKHAAAMGAGICHYLESYAKLMVSQARLGLLCNRNVIFVNMPYMNCSETLRYLLDKSPLGESADIAASYYVDGEGVMRVSLRSKNDVDVSLIAKHYGGGGHRAAAGFELRGDQAFELLLNFVS